MEYACIGRGYTRLLDPRYGLKEEKNSPFLNRIPVYRIPMVHERRRFTDVMDEEIDEERRHRNFIDKYTVGFIRSRMETCSLDMPRRLKMEIPSRLAIREESRTVKEEATTIGTAPFFREKPNTCAITEGKPLTLTALVTGQPEPIVQWLRNETIIGEVTSPRIAISNEKGRSTLTYSECKDFDVGLYRVVARNTLGQVTHKFRLVQGHLPGCVDTPEVTEVSDTEALVRWRLPIDDGGYAILCYHLQIRKEGESEWTTLSENIDHEFYLASKLTPDTSYQFRVKAQNVIGWGDFSAITKPVKTAPTGAEKIELNRGMIYLQRQTEEGKKIQHWHEGRELDYNKEQDPVKIKTGENAELQIRKYNPVAEWGRGRFALVAKCVRTDDRRHFAVKVLSHTGREKEVENEAEMARTLRHERIVQLYEAYSLGSLTMLVLEPLAGVDILTYLASQYQYSEQQVYTVIIQVMDALSYLHWRGYCHLDIQPDNIVLTSTRRCDVKLIDFGNTQQVSKVGSHINYSGHHEYMAPEVLLEQKAFPSSDVWSLGVVMYALLAGASAFQGIDDEETNSNIQYVRYKFEHLSPATTQEAVRFLMLIFKRDPSKRPTVDECRDHKWMLESDHITKKRERAVFFGSRLKEYDMAYHKARIGAATKSMELLNFNDAAFVPRIEYDPNMLGDL